MSLRYIADDQVCLVLVGIRTVERIYVPGSSTHRLRVTYKGHDCEHGYPSLEGLDAIYTRLVAALTAQPTQAMEAVLRDKERLTQRLRVAIEELYRLNDPDVKAITDRLVQIYREL